MHPNSPNSFSITRNQHNPLQFVPYGMAMLTGGLVQVVQINGVGLLTDGFIWQAPEYWFHPQSMYGVSTSWSAAAGYSGCVSASLISNSWTAAAGYSGCAAASLITTAWTNSSLGQYGEASG